jgi:hypothetical protein
MVKKGTTKANGAFGLSISTLREEGRRRGKGEGHLDVRWR